MPILLLTALGTIEHRAEGAELGADDYLVKPFAFAELLARVRVLCCAAGRRSSSKASFRRPISRRFGQPQGDARRHPHHPDQ